ncbi:hypothetical protein ACLMJK_001008 [Lecanora helva]
MAAMTVAHLQLRPAPGLGVFSSRNGKYKLRPAAFNMSVVIRSDPKGDRDTMAAKLLAEFPEICKAMNPRPSSEDVNAYFDTFDQVLQGFGFLHAVLERIAALNRKNYIKRWLATNSVAFTMLTPDHTIEQLFVQDDIDEYGKQFLEDAAAQIKRQKQEAIQRGERCYAILIAELTLGLDAGESALRAQQHYDQMPLHRKAMLSQTLPHGHYSGYPPVSTNWQTSSNPDQSQHSLQRNVPLSDFTNQLAHQHEYNPHRYFSPPSSQTSMRALSGNTTLSKGHSDSAYGAAGTPYYPAVDYNKPFHHQGYSSPVTHSPQLNSQSTDFPWSNNYQRPKGRRNPGKRWSDDARRGALEPDIRYQASGYRRSSHLSAPQMVQSPLSMPSSMPSSVQSFSKIPRPAPDLETLVDFPTVDNQQQQQHRMPERGLMNTRAAAPPRMNDDRERSAAQIDVYQTPQNALDASLGRHSSIRIEGTPGNTSSVQEARNLRPTGYPSDSQQPSQPSHITQSYPPDLRLPTAGSNAAPNMATSVQRPSQAPLPMTPRHFKNQNVTNQNVEPGQGVKIFINQIPMGTTQSMVSTMLEACPGFSDVIAPRHSKLRNPPYLFAFAFFQSISDAQKAIEQIPQMQVPNSSGRLFADWAYAPDSPSPNPHQKNRSIPRQAMPHPSPTRVRKGNFVENPDMGPGWVVKTHSRHKSGNNVGDRTVASTSRSRTDVVETSSAVTNIPETSTNVSPSIPTANPFRSLDSTVNKEANVRLKPTVSDDKPAPEDEDSHGKTSLHANQEKKGAESNLTPTTRTDTKSSSNDGANDLVDKSGGAKEPRLEQVKSKDPNPSVKRPKKNMNKDKNSQAKGSSQMRKADIGTSSKGVHNLENIKPLSGSPEKPTNINTSKQTLLQGDGVKIAGTDISASETLSTEVTNGQSHMNAKAGTKAQLATDSSIAVVRPNELREVNNFDQRRPSSKGALMRKITNQPHDSQSPSMNPESGVVPNKTSVSVVETTHLKSSTPIETQNEGKEHQVRAIMRDDHASISEEDGSASFPQSSTLPTSYVHSERSDSTAGDVLVGPVHVAEQIESASETQNMSSGPDVSKLDTLLQDKSTAAQDITSAGYYQLPPEPTRVEEQTTEVPRIDSPVQDLENNGQIAPLVIDLSDLSPEVIRMMSETENLLRVQDDLSTAFTIPEPSTPGLDLQHPEQKLTLSLPSSSIPPKQLSEPIQTRHKKKPKQFTPVKEDINVDPVPLSTISSASQHSQDEDPNVRPSSDGQAKSPTSLQAKTLQQKKSSKTKKKKKSKKSTTSVAESLVRPPSLDIPRPLPEPETPFQTDISIISPAPSRAVIDEKKQTEALGTPGDYTVAVPTEMNDIEGSIMELTGSRPEDNSYTGTIDGGQTLDPAIVRFVPLNTSVEDYENLYGAIEEAGYHLTPEPSSSRHFGINDPMLAPLEEIMDDQEQGHIDGNREYAIELASRAQNMGKQWEVIQLCKEVAEGKRLQASLPPESTIRRDKKPKIAEDGDNKLQTPADDLSQVQLLHNEVEKIAAELIMNKISSGVITVGDSVQDDNIQAAQLLTKCSPLGDPPYTEIEDWLMYANTYIEQKDAMLGNGSPFSPPAAVNLPQSNPLSQVQSKTLASALASAKVEESKTLSKSAADQVPSEPHNQGSSASEVQSTRSSPRTLGHRTPSTERKQQAFPPPAWRSSWPTGSAIGPLTSNQPQGTGDESHKSDQSAIIVDQERSEKVEGSWGQDSGARDSEIDDQTQAKGEMNPHGIQQVEQPESVKNLQGRLSELPTVVWEDTQKTSENQEIPVIETAPGKEEVVSSIRNSNNDDSEKCSRLVEQQKGAPDKDRVTQIGNQDPYDTSNTPDEHSLDILQAPGFRPASDPNESGAEASNEPLQITQPRTSESQVFETRSFEVSKDDEENSAHPDLPPDSGSPSKRGERTSPTRSGYAAVVAANTQEGTNNQREEATRSRKTTRNNDGWAVAGDEAWGSGRASGSKSRGRRDTY